MKQASVLDKSNLHFFMQHCDNITPFWDKMARPARCWPCHFIPKGDCIVNRAGRAILSQKGIVLSTGLAVPFYPKRGLYCQPGWPCHFIPKGDDIVNRAGRAIFPKRKWYCQPGWACHFIPKGNGIVNRAGRAILYQKGMIFSQSKKTSNDQDFF